MLFCETYFEESNINWKHFIGSQAKILTKFDKKKMGDFGFGQGIRKHPKN